MGGVPTQETIVVSQGLGRLTYAYATQPNIVGILKSFLQQFQKYENALYPALAARYLRTATVYALPLTNVVFDVIGLIVGQPRLGMSDTDYQVALLLRVAVNRSAGRMSDWSRIAGLLLRISPGPAILTEGTAAFTLFIGQLGGLVAAVGGQVNPNIVASILSGAHGLGIGSQLVYTTWPVANTLILSDANNPGLVLNGGKLGDAGRPNPANDGLWASTAVM
jgi:hypothetical protein